MIVYNGGRGMMIVCACFKEYLVNNNLIKIVRATELMLLSPKHM